MIRHFSLAFFGLTILLTAAAQANGQAPLSQEPNTWVKRSPLKDGPPSPRLGHENSQDYDPVARRVIRWGGHSQGGIKGSGEQISELWTLDPATMKWELKEPNRSPPPACCVMQNVFDVAQNRFLRFKSGGGNHGWHWYRQVYLNNSSVWNYDLAQNTWRDMRPLPEPLVGFMRCASWDSDHQVAVVFGGEGITEGTVVFDPYANTWTRMHPKNEPRLGAQESRSGGTLAYDAARKLHILFGSQFSDDPHTWAYDLKKNAWIDLKPAKMPPTDRNDAVLSYDSANQVIVAVIRVNDSAEGKQVAMGHLETWVYDAGKNTWTHMKPAREPDGWAGRSRTINYLPDQNLFLMDVSINPAQRVPNVEREQQVWTYRYANDKPERALPAPTGVRVTTTADGALLEWQPSKSTDGTGYAIYRGEGNDPWHVNFKQIGQVERKTTSYRDPKLKAGTVYHYCVRALFKDGTESGASLKVRAQPRIVEDAVVSVISAKEVRLTWTPPCGHTDIAGFHVERAVVEVLSEDEVFRLKKDTPPLAEPSVGAFKLIGKFARLTKEPLKEVRFTDATVDLAKAQSVEGDWLYRNRFTATQLDTKGKPYRYAVYAYRLRAVNALGVESGPSPYFLTVPSAPQHLFSREEGEKCHLKWAANPELGIKGYRVYWMKGPRPEGPGQAAHRLTADPIAVTRYTDAQAGKEVRRFWVVAVDALGQEGIPSSPTWHYRTQRSFYVPFVGEWHQ